jgi:hypothetical protein
MHHAFMHAGAQWPVIVTSFEIVIADAKFLQKYKLKALIVDEGHRLKNFNCRRENRLGANEEEEAGEKRRGSHRLQRMQEARAIGRGWEPF